MTKKPKKAVKRGGRWIEYFGKLVWWVQYERFEEWAIESRQHCHYPNSTKIKRLAKHLNRTKFRP